MCRILNKTQSDFELSFFVIYDNLYSRRKKRKEIMIMLDVIVVIVYFFFLMLIGWLFRTFSKNTSDYFKGGGKMLWWMVGATAFMTQFSAWSFTGAAGKAFTDGLSILVIFLGNAIGYFANYWFFAAKSRQMRVVTPIEGIRLRFGKVNEQVFTWATVPYSILQAGIWLNGLAIFVAAVFKISMPTTIIITGVIVVLMSVSGGAWAVIASDFLQMVIIMAVSFIASVVAIVKSGGVVPVFANGLPENPITGPGVNYIALFVLWVIASIGKQFMTTNNMIDSYRYMCAKDTKNARKAALLACILMFVGPVIWFIPDWFVAANYSNTDAWGLASLGKSIKDATYYVFVHNELPVGMVGLMMAAMFAATMSSMDSALNRNAGILVRNFYKVFINKNADEDKMLKIGKLSTLFLGAIIIMVGLFLNSLQETSLFNIMMMVSSLIALPMLIPALFGFFVKKTPDWSAWATILVGAAVSCFVAFVVTPEMIEKIFHLSTPLTSREFSDLQSMTLGVGLHACITLPFFLISQLFYKGRSKERQEEVDLFFNNVETEVVSDENEGDDLDNQQRGMLGKLIFIMGIAVMALMIVPNPLSGRLVFIGVGGIVSIVGGGLLLSARTSKKKV